MKFTPGQVQETLQLSPATFRHWKTALPPLNGRSGYTPCFTLGDLLALAAVKSLTEDIGIKVGCLHKVAAELFAHCGHGSWAGLERSVLLIEPLSARITALQEGQAPQTGNLAILLPLRPLIRLLQDRLLLGHEEDQQEPLRFPPTPIGIVGGRRGDA